MVTCRRLAGSLLSQLEELFSKELRTADDWVRVKLMAAKAIANLLTECYGLCIRRIVLVELSGGEPVDSYEGGLDIDLYVEAKPECTTKVKEEASTLNNIVNKALLNSKGLDFVNKLRRLFNKGLNHNLLELHVNSSFLKPLIDGKNHYKLVLVQKD
ncbi:MAG: hypothetical protein ABWW69_05445 [Pyrodictiaceae archaeon]